MRDLSRRQPLAGALGTLGVATLGACARGTEAVPAGSSAVRRAEAARQAAGQKVVVARLAPRPATLDLGGPIVDTWAYGDSLPGPLLRAWSSLGLRLDAEHRRRGQKPSRERSSSGHAPTGAVTVRSCRSGRSSIGVSGRMSALTPTVETCTTDRPSSIGRPAYCW